ncbi:hypothetical protein [Rhizobium sp. 32-5/1]|uniref:hypothetical protein n=1 Tax=Rhizobium sp. 32-5/1 TaxID=3019602 RepID=UPI0032B828E0
MHGADELAFKALEDRLGRASVKETTLDYIRDFANRRGSQKKLVSLARSRLIVLRCSVRIKAPLPPISQGSIRTGLRSRQAFMMSDFDCRPVLSAVAKRLLRWGDVDNRVTLSFERTWIAGPTRFS